MSCESGNLKFRLKMQNKESAEKIVSEKSPYNLVLEKSTYNKKYVTTVTRTDGKETVNGIVSKYNKIARYAERGINE